MKINKINKKKKGFTLIELIVVVSIVLILSSLVIPKVLGYQDKAKTAKVVNTASQIFNASMANFTEKEGKFISNIDLKEAINAVTDIGAADADVVLNTDKNAANIKFVSDAKNYNIQLNASTNSFSIFNGVESTNAIYSNK